MTALYLKLEVQQESVGLSNNKKSGDNYTMSKKDKRDINRLKQSTSLLSKCFGSIVSLLIAYYRIILGLFTKVTLFVFTLIIVISLMSASLVIINGRIEFIPSTGTSQSSQDSTDKTMIGLEGDDLYWEMTKALDIDKIESDYETNSDMKNYFDRELNIRVVSGRPGPVTPGKFLDIFKLFEELNHREELNGDDYALKIYMPQMIGSMYAESTFGMGSNKRLCDGIFTYSGVATIGFYNSFGAGNAWGYYDPYGQRIEKWNDNNSLTGYADIGYTYISEDFSADTPVDKRAIFGGLGNLKANNAVYVTKEHLTRLDGGEPVNTSDPVIQRLILAGRGRVNALPDASYTWLMWARLMFEKKDIYTHRDTNNSVYGESMIPSIQEQFAYSNIPQDKQKEYLIKLLGFMQCGQRYGTGGNRDKIPTGDVGCANLILVCEGAYDEYLSNNELTARDLDNFGHSKGADNITYSSDGLLGKTLNKISNGESKYKYSSEVISSARRCLNSCDTFTSYGAQSYLAGTFIYNELIRLTKSYYDYQDASGSYKYRKYNIVTSNIEGNSAVEGEPYELIAGSPPVYLGEDKRYYVYKKVPKIDYSSIKTQSDLIGKTVLPVSYNNGDVEDIFSLPSGFRIARQKEAGHNGVDYNGMSYTEPVKDHLISSCSKWNALSNKTYHVTDGDRCAYSLCLHCTRGTNVCAMWDGTVINVAKYNGGGNGKCGTLAGYGVSVKVRHQVGSLSFIVVYAHFAADTINPVIKDGYEIKAGEFIATEGTTGDSTGIHCHIDTLNESTGRYLFTKDLLKNG